MPYNSEHSARLRDPGDFKEDSFRRKKLDKPGLSVIIARLEGENSTTTQAYRFNRQQWTEQEARDWLKENDIKYILFEPATGGNGSAAATDAAKTEEKTAAVGGDNNPGEGETMEVTMSLKDILAQNPDAKAEYEQELKARYDSGVTAGEEKLQKRINAATPYIGNENYPGIESLAAKVLKGEEEISALTGAVTAYDMLKEQGKSAAAKSETGQQKETPGEQHGQQSADGVINSIDDIAAFKQRRSAESRNGEAK